MGEAIHEAHLVDDETDASSASRQISTHLIDDALGPVIRSSDRMSDGADGIVDYAAANSKLVRYGLVTVEGLAYTVPGVLNGLHYNLTHLPEFGLKMGVAAGIGVGMRLLLPQKGAARAIAGATMGYMLVKDALTPIREAYAAVETANDMQTVHLAAAHMGNGLGLFAVDSVAGIKVAKWAEGGTGRLLQSRLGPDRYLAFENGKDVFWNSDKYWHGRALGWVGKKASVVTTAIAERLMTRRQHAEMPLSRQLELIDQAGKESHIVTADTQLYMQGPLAQNGRRINFTEFLDALEKGHKPSEILADPSIILVEGPGRRLAGSDIVVPETPRIVEVRPGNAKLTGIEAEYDAANMLRLADQARKMQERWTDESSQLADIKDGFKSPVHSVSDATRKGALLGPEYNASAGQLVSVAEQISTVEHLKNAGFVLDLHAKAASQQQLGHPLVLDMNMFAEELHGVFINGLRRAGVSDNVLAGKVPSRVALAADGGSGNFTIPNIDGVIDRPVTLFPRSQTSLASVLAGINRHEQIGHDHVYGDLAKFPAEFRESMVGNVILNAMREAKIEDVNINVPGRGSVKKSEFFKQLLIAQANENTADIVGTATGGPDTALTLGVLLQSLRKGGKLETRNVLGQQFPDFVEPHGMDGWRIKLSAEVMRQMANGDKHVLRAADALDTYANQASRTDTHYQWASLDHEGQMVRIPRHEWDSVIPHIVRAQLDTPLNALEGKTFRDILPDLPATTRRIDALATKIADSVEAGSRDLTGPFDKTQFTIGEVFASGMTAWQRAVARGENPARALELINSISEGLRAQYRQGNPHHVNLVPAAVEGVKPTTLTKVADFAGRTVKMQPKLGPGLASHSTAIGGAAGALVMGDILEKHRLKLKLEAEAGK
jgi:hypothetical protein